MGKTVKVEKVRVNWPRIFKPEASAMYPNNPPQYSMNVLLDPKKDKKAIDALQAAMDAEADAFKGKKYDEPPSWKKADSGLIELRLSAAENRKPQVVDENVQPIMSADEIYAGCYCNVVIDVYSNSKFGNKVSTGLVAVQKVADGERLDGYVAPDAEELFAPIKVTGNGVLD